MDSAKPKDKRCDLIVGGGLVRSHVAGLEDLAQQVPPERQGREGDDRRKYVFPSTFRGAVPMGDVTLNHLSQRTRRGVA